MERVFRWRCSAFHERNFALRRAGQRASWARASTSRWCAASTRSELQPGWLDEGKALCRELGTDSVRAMRGIIARVRAEAPTSGDEDFSRELAARLRAEEAKLRVRARALAARLSQAVPQGLPLTDIGDRVATPLQRARAEVSL